MGLGGGDKKVSSCPERGHITQVSGEGHLIFMSEDYVGRLPLSLDRSVTQTKGQSCLCCQSGGLSWEVWWV